MTWLENSPAFQYLHDVLGIRWAKPSDVEPLVVVLAGKSVDAATRALIERMMAAAKIQGYAIVSEPVVGPGVGLVMDEAESLALGLRDPGAAVNLNGRHWIRSLEPHLLLEGSPDLVNANKRVAWAHLQELSRLVRETR